MLSSKSLLFLLMSLLLFVNFFPTLQKEDLKALRTLKLYQAKLHQEKALLQKRPQLQTRIEEAEKRLKTDEHYFFAPTVKPSIAFSRIQKRIKRLVSAGRGKIVAITWGEPYKDPEGAYEVLPLRVVVHLAPEKLYPFFEGLFAKNPKLTVMRSLMLVKKRKDLLVSMQIESYKRVANP